MSIYFVRQSGIQRSVLHLTNAEDKHFLGVSVASGKPPWGAHAAFPARSSIFSFPAYNLQNCPLTTYDKKTKLLGCNR